MAEQPQQPEDPLGQLLDKVRGLSRVLQTPARDAGTLTLTLRNWIIPILAELVQAQQQIAAAFGTVAYQSGRALVLSERNAAVDVIEQVAELVEELGPHVGPGGLNIYAQVSEALVFFLDDDEEGETDDEGGGEGEEEGEQEGLEVSGAEDPPEAASEDVEPPRTDETVQEAEDAQP